MGNKKEILSSEMQEELKNIQNKTNNSRRSFLKKSAYAAPVLMAMGQLAKPTLTHATDSNVPDCPDWVLDCQL